METNKSDGANEEFFELVKAGTNKSIEDVVEEIFKYFKCRSPFLSGRGILARILTSLVQQSKEEERAKVGNLILAEPRWIWRAPLKEMADWIHSLSNTPKT